MVSKFYAPLLKKRAELENDERGFTLIELLVVVLIIGILAAIAIPVFIGQQESAKDASAKSDLSNGKVAAIAFATDHGGSYVGAEAAGALTNYGFVASTDRGTVVKSATATNFCIQATGGNSLPYKVTKDGQITQAAC